DASDAAFAQRQKNAADARRKAAAADKGSVGYYTDSEVATNQQALMQLAYARSNRAAYRMLYNMQVQGSNQGLGLDEIFAQQQAVVRQSFPGLAKQMDAYLQQVSPAAEQAQGGLQGLVLWLRNLANAISGTEGGTLSRISKTTGRGGTSTESTYVL